MIKILAVTENLKVKIHQEAQVEKKEDQIQDQDQEEGQKMTTLWKMQSKRKRTQTQIFPTSEKTTIIKLIQISTLKMIKIKWARKVSKAGEAAKIRELLKKYEWFVYTEIDCSSRRAN